MQTRETIKIESGKMSQEELKNFYFNNQPLESDTLFIPTKLNLENKLAVTAKPEDGTVSVTQEWCAQNKESKAYFNWMLKVDRLSRQKICWINNRELSSELQRQGYMLEWQSAFEDFLRKNNINVLRNEMVLVGTKRRGMLVWPLYGFRIRKKASAEGALQLTGQFRKYVLKRYPNKKLYGFNRRLLNFDYYSRISDIIQTSLNHQGYGQSKEEDKIGKKWLEAGKKGYSGEKYIGLDWDNYNIEDTLVFTMYLKERGRDELVEKFYPDFVDNEKIAGKLQASNNSQKDFLIEKYYHNL